MGRDVAIRNINPFRQQPYHGCGSQCKHLHGHAIAGTSSCQRQQFPKNQKKGCRERHDTNTPMTVHDFPPPTEGV